MMLIERFAENPLIVPADVPPSRPDYQVVGVFNPGVIKYKGEVLLLLRVAERPKDKAPDEELAPILDLEIKQIRCLKVKHSAPDLEVRDSRIFYYKGKMYLTSISHLRLARSKDGRHFEIDPHPAIFPAESCETFGVEDPRITQINSEFYITYKVVSEYGICTALLKSQDFRKFKRQGIIFCPENIDVVLFPEKIGGKFYALTRPVPRNIGPRAIWLASSPDLTHWGGHKMLLPPSAGGFDAGKVGASCVPIKTNAGWLEVYHAADQNDRYYLAATLLDLKDPSKVIARSKEPLMQPEADYETTGFYGNVIFSCGAIVDADGTVTIYYGAADAVTAGATTTIDKIMNTLR